MFADRYRLKRNWLKGFCTVRTFEGHSQGKEDKTTRFYLLFTLLSLTHSLCLSVSFLSQQAYLAFSLMTHVLSAALGTRLLKSELHTFGKESLLFLLLIVRCGIVAQTQRGQLSH